MSEFIREVNEEYQRERLMALWQRFGGLMIGLVLLGVVAVGGWTYFQHQKRVEAQAAAALFEEVNALTRANKTAEAEALLTRLSADKVQGYAVLARFKSAALEAGKDIEKGAAAYEALAKDAALPVVLQDLARLRRSLLTLDKNDTNAIKDLSFLAVPNNPWRHSARELLGLQALKANDHDKAGRWFDQMVSDPETPQNLRSRIDLYMALVAGGPVATAP
jgi:hypothetical protein